MSKMRIDQALQCCRLEWFNNSKGEWVISHADTQAVIACIIDNRRELAERLANAYQLQSSLSAANQRIGELEKELADAVEMLAKSTDLARNQLAAKDAEIKGLQSVVINYQSEILGIKKVFMEYPDSFKRTAAEIDKFIAEQQQALSGVVEKKNHRLTADHPMVQATLRAIAEDEALSGEQKEGA